MWTPFPYGIFFPVSIYMGKVAGAALAQDLFIQFMWVAATYALARMVWQRGAALFPADEKLRTKLASKP